MGHPPTRHTIELARSNGPDTNDKKIGGLGKLQVNDSAGVRPLSRRMKHATPVILVLAAMICGISTAALNANHVFDGRIWIAWCGYGVTGALLLIAALIAVLNSKREKEKESLPPPPPSPHKTQQVNQQANPVQTVLRRKGICTVDST